MDTHEEPWATKKELSSSRQRLLIHFGPPQLFFLKQVHCNCFGGYFLSTQLPTSSGFSEHDRSDVYESSTLTFLLWSRELCYQLVSYYLQPVLLIFDLYYTHTFTPHIHSFVIL